MDIDAELTRIFAEDELGLFDVRPKKSFAKTADQRLIDSFEEINAVGFVIPKQVQAFLYGSSIVNSGKFRVISVQRQ